MATYVFSDVHGHAAPLERLLARLSPTSDDRIYMLGDMIDRGPSSVRVMQVCRSLPNCTVLKGNHEQLMLSFFANPSGDMEQINWVINGGGATARDLMELERDQRDELIEWVRGLPLWQVERVGSRPYVLVHAGILPVRAMPRGECLDEELELMLRLQDEEDLVWVREDFWRSPTGLLDAEGRGAIVIAGHTPTPYLASMVDLVDRPSYNEDGRAQMVRVGACEETGHVADRWDIDCCAAAGSNGGQVMILRLDDGEELYEPVLEGE